MEAGLEGRDPKPACAYEAERDEWGPLDKFKHVYPEANEE
jgi:hypothetical protein